MEAGIVCPNSSARLLPPVRRERLSRLCVLMNPNLPGAIHQDLAGYIIDLATLAGRTVPGDARAKPAFRRSILPDRNALVDEPAHADIHCHTQRQERE